MLTNDDLQEINKNLEEHLSLFSDAEMERDQQTYCTFRPSELHNTKEAIDELLALRSIRDAGDEEVEKLRHTIADLGPSLAGEADRLRDIAISRGQELREAREEIERLKEEMETSVSEAEERANERGRRLATLTAERDEVVGLLQWLANSKIDGLSVMAATMTNAHYGHTESRRILEIVEGK